MKLKCCKITRYTVFEPPTCLIKTTVPQGYISALIDLSWKVYYVVSLLGTFQIHVKA